MASTSLTNEAKTPSAYSNSSSYDKVQNSRKDYSSAVACVLATAEKYIADTSSRRRRLCDVADFCSGTGSISKRLTDKVPDGLGNLTLIDNNEQFVQDMQSDTAQFHAQDVTPVLADITQWDVGTHARFDAVIACFAYHHVCDERKHLFVEKARACLRPGGVVFVAEIYLEDFDEVLKYYERLIAELESAGQGGADVKEFLWQTAHDTTGEFKVAQSRATEDFERAGFVLSESTKIWPDDNEGYWKDKGCYVQVWRRSSDST